MKTEMNEKLMKWQRKIFTISISHCFYNFYLTWLFSEVLLFWFKYLCFHIRELWQEHWQGEKGKDMTFSFSFTQNWNKDWQWWWGKKTICRWQLLWLLYKRKKCQKGQLKKPNNLPKNFLLWVWRSDLDYRMHKAIAQE